MANTAPITDGSNVSRAGEIQGPDNNPLLDAARQLADGLNIPAATVIGALLLGQSTLDGTGRVARMDQFGTTIFNQGEGSIMWILRLMLTQLQVTNALLRLQLEQDYPEQGFQDMTDETLATMYVPTDPTS